MKTITKIFIALILGVVFALGAFPNIARAEDYGQEITLMPSDVSMNVSVNYSCGGLTGVSTGSTTYLRSTLRSYQSMTGDGWDDAFQCGQTYAENSTRLPLTDKLFHSASYGNADTISLSNVNFAINYDMPTLSGWYTATYDVYIGVGVGYPRNNVSSYCVNTFTVDGSAEFYTDSFEHTYIIQYIDTVQSTFVRTNTMRFDLLHFRVIYQGSNDNTHLALNLAPYIADHIAGWQASGVYGNGYDGAFYSLQAFADMHLYYEAEPPATPTPIPTPYPGQDTQESINAGVDAIESQVNVVVNILDAQATPIPHPDDLTIDETIFDALDDMTLPDVTPAQSTFTNLWSIFNPLWAFVGLFAGSMTLVGIFMYCLKGRFI